VNVRETRLFGDLVDPLAERFSRTGHVMQQVERENRGHCPPGECCLRCTTYTALLLEACDVLEAEMQQPQQIDLFGSEVAG
jgi:hypothetical protein